MDYNEIISLRKAFASVKKRQAERPPHDIDKKIMRLKEIRESSVGNQGLLESAMERLKENGIEVFRAEDKDDVLNIVLRTIGNERLVVKSKSNVTKEIELASELCLRGIEVIETDIGDRILQVLGGRPSHPTGPVAHLSAKAIAAGLTKFHGTSVSDNPDEIVRFVREEIRGYIERAGVGISGANAVTAEDGSIVLAHNEGNIYEVMRKEKHIVITAIDKIYPSVEDALNMIKVISFKATGSVIPSFVEIISGVSKTADVEKKFFRGVHSPREVVLILVDNKRSELMEKGYKDLLCCIDCGNCLMHCPMYNAVGNYFAEGKYLGGKGLACLSLSRDEADKKLEYCLSCGRCRRNCPLSIDVPGIIRAIRSDNIGGEALCFLKSHIFWLYHTIMLKIHS